MMIVFVFGEKAREVFEDVFFEAGDSLGHKQSGRRVAGQYIYQPILDPTFLHDLVHPLRDVDSFFGFPALDFHFLELDDH
jgi:hypothetical protein